jgi:transposase
VYQNKTVFDVISIIYIREGVGMESIVMSKRKQLQIHTISNLSAGKLTFKEAMHLVGKSERTVRRWLRCYEKNGLAFINHGNRARAPVNKTKDELKFQIMKFMESELFDFNMLHALEKIEQQFNLKITREKFRKWCHEYKLVKQAHHKRRSKPRYKRPRLSQAGFMLQLDGSPHRWFNSEESCLIAAIDDATSTVMGGQFFPTETMFGTFQVLSKIFEKHGLPSVIYVDRAGIYGGQKRTNFSQLVRALDELGVQIIYANSPQAKGRIERLFKTLQDRLIPEMRLAGISNQDQANKYFNEIYLPHLHNPKFSVQAEIQSVAWRAIAPHIKLENIFCIKETRRVANDHTFSYNGEKYLITTELKYSIYNHDLELIIDAKNQMKIIFAGRELSYCKVSKGPTRIAA